jgi:hypothetical protein
MFGIFFLRLILKLTECDTGTITPLLSAKGKSYKGADLETCKTETGIPITAYIPGPALRLCKKSSIFYSFNLFQYFLCDLL